MVRDNRFEIRRTLGEGGMGVVYEARDTARDMIVALKTLRFLDANLLYHFKNEFRSIADLHHPNLVTLYELFEAEGQWFFTMELVEGCDFATWIRPRAEASTETFASTMHAGHSGQLSGLGPTPGAGGTLLEYVTPAQRITPLPVPTAVPLPYDEPRLRDSLAQLAAGLHTLHDAGKVHRDIKPNNILVARDGRVVIMDYGLVADAALLAELRSVRQIAGTPVFMAPEQGVPGATVSNAADWYAVGVMLYHVLTNRMPFAGTTVQELTLAKHTPPPAPSQIATGVPGDLAELCVRLLAPEPAARPTGEEVLRLLGGKTARRTAGDVFVGRRAELGVLHAAVADSRRGVVPVFVEGPSGLGKSALVRRFLDELAGSDTMILSGRCYAEETVPYKAFDGIVDALSRHLLTMDPGRADEIVPASAPLAARLFPVLLRVPQLRGGGDAGELSGLELRARAFVALGELLQAVATTQPLVLFVDDLQWADADSLLLLRELLGAESPPQLAFIASVRTSESSNVADDLARSARLEPRRIKLAPLAPEDAALLVDRLLPRDAATAERRQEIAREAAGHPLFLAELSLHQATDSPSTTRLDDALWERALGLDPESRQLLQVIAVAGMPIAQRAVADAANLSPTRCAPLLTGLRVARFVKTAGDDRVEPYHDRVRESVVARLPSETLAQVSGGLARALLHAGIGETAPELVVRHLFAAGDLPRGRDLAERAAERALAMLAFDRAAELYRAAITAGPRDAAHGRALHLALAGALASGGRGAEAADAFLAAAGAARIPDPSFPDLGAAAGAARIPDPSYPDLGAAAGAARIPDPSFPDLGAAAGATAGTDEAQPSEWVIDCRRRAADQLLASGHVARGLAELSDVLAQLGERVPASPRESLASLEPERAAIDAGPIVFHERREIPADLLRRLDVYQSTSIGLLLVDNVRGADYQARALRIAIAAGEPRRLLRALVFEAIYRAQESDAGRSRADELIARAATIARGRGDAWMDSYLVLASAFAAYYRGQFRRAVELFKDCDVRFRAFAGVAWEQNTIRLHRLRATDYQGAWGELRALYDEYLRDARRRDDRYVEASITRWFNVLWLAHDRPDLAGADLDRSVWTSPDEGRYHLQHFLELRARVELALYRGDGAAQGVWARPGLDAADRSLLLRIEIARVIADWLLGRIAACEGNVDEIEHRANLLAEHKINYAAIWGGLLAAAAIAQRGDRAGAIARLASVAWIADANDFPLCATIARFRSAQLEDDPVAVQAAYDWMTRQEIRNPIRMCDVFAPGF